MTQRRTTFALLAGVTIFAGIAVRFAATFLPMAIRDVMGDALWAFMVASLISAIVPERSTAVRCSAALLVVYGIEFSQLIHTPTLDQLRNTLPGHLVLGQGFDARDLLAYLAGVVVFALFSERVVARCTSRHAF